MQAQTDTDRQTQTGCQTGRRAGNYTVYAAGSRKADIVAGLQEDREACRQEAMQHKGRQWQASRWTGRQAGRKLCSRKADRVAGKQTDW